MSLDDENTTVPSEPRYQLWNNTRSFEPISLSSRSSQQYHQTSIAPPSSNTTHTRNSSSSYTTSMVHQSPFGGVTQWGMPIITLAFTPSPYISLQVVTCTFICTMEVRNSSSKIEKFNGKSSSISLREFKVTFSTMVCELEFKYSVNYVKAFTLKKTNPLCALWGIRCLQITFFEDFGCHPDPQSSLCYSHHHRLSSCTTNYHCTSWDYAQ